MSDQANQEQNADWNTTCLALDIARELPAIPISLVRSEVMKAVAEAGNADDREAVKTQVLKSLHFLNADKSA